MAFGLSLLERIQLQGIEERMAETHGRDLPEDSLYSQQQRQAYWEGKEQAANLSQDQLELFTVGTDGKDTEGTDEHTGARVQSLRRGTG